MSVKKKGGGRMSVSAPPTLEQFKAMQSAPTRKPAKRKIPPPPPPRPTALPSGLGIVRSSRQDVPLIRPECVECGRPYYKHMNRNSDIWCSGYVDPNQPGVIDPVVIDLDLADDDDDAVDEYQAMAWSIPDHLQTDDEDGPPAGVSRSDWEAQERAAEEEEEHNRRELRMAAETEVLTAQWREEIERRPPR